MNIWPGLVYLWIWGQAIGSFFSHSPKFLLATVFEPNKLASFQSNFKNKFKLWCWGRSVNGDPYLHTACSLRKGPWPWFGCSCFKEPRIRERRRCSVSFTTPALSSHISAIAMVAVGARMLTDCTSTTESLGNFRKPRRVKIHL